MHPGAVDKRSSEQQFCKSNLCCVEILGHTSSIIGSYGKLAGRQKLIQLNFKFLKFAIDHFLLRSTKLQCYYSSMNAFKLVFLL